MEPREFGRLEGTVAAQGKRIDSLDSKLDAHTKKLDRIIAFQERQRGGARMLLIFSTAAASTFGALASMAVEWFKTPPGHP